MPDEKHTGTTSPYVYYRGDGTHISYVKQYAPESEVLFSPAIDGFGRSRVSQPETLFDSNFIDSGASAKSPLIWDESITNNSGSAIAVHSASNAAITLYAGPNDTVIRQTYSRFNYQPGKNQQVLMTGVIGSGGSGITSHIGVYDGQNGMFWENKDGEINLCIAKGGSINRVPQSSWNIDRMDGTGDSGITIDWDKNQIFIVEYEWLGVGGVAYGLFVNRSTYYVHFENKANNSDSGAYISTPNLPVRYSIENTSASPSEITQICSTVISEGGIKQTGQLRFNSLGAESADEVQASTGGTTYAICGIKLKSSFPSRTARPTNVSIVNTTNGNILWQISFRPTLSSPLLYTDEPNSACQFGIADAGQTLTDLGTVIAGGYISNDLESLDTNIESVLSLGVSIAGVSDEFVLSVTPINDGQDILGGIGWREQ